MGQSRERLDGQEHIANQLTMTKEASVSESSIIS